nr:SRPBCC family protein [Acidobacteriota bacterium]
MGSVRRHVHINRDPETVWALVGDLARQHEWFPLQSCRVEGKKRWITSASGLTFEEDIVTHDHSLRRFQYRIVGNPGITAHLGTCDVIDDGHGGSTVVYSTDMEPEAFALVIAGAAGAGLEKLKRLMESN